MRLCIVVLSLMIAACGVTLPRAPETTVEIRRTEARKVPSICKHAIDLGCLDDDEVQRRVVIREDQRALLATFRNRLLPLEFRRFFFQNVLDAVPVPQPTAQIAMVRCEGELSMFRASMRALPDDYVELKAQSEEIGKRIEQGGDGNDANDTEVFLNRFEKRLTVLETDLRIVEAALTDLLGCHDIILRVTNPFDGSLVFQSKPFRTRQDRPVSP